MNQLLLQAQASGHLDLSTRELKQIPKEIFPSHGAHNAESGIKWWESSDLQKLILAFNEISEIPPSISELQELVYLDFRDNKISNLPSELLQLQNLSFLNLGQNCLTTVNSLTALKNLAELRLFQNRIITLGEGWESLKCLTSLDLSQNQLEVLPESLCSVTSLMTLKVPKNRLKRIPKDIHKIIHLQEVDLSENQIETLPEDFAAGESIVTILLRKNRLKSLPILRSATLRELYLGENLISDIAQKFCELKKLEVLDLDSNQISEVPLDIAQLTNLKRLDLGNNTIPRLPNELGNMNLSSLIIDGNPLRAMRHDVLKKEPHEILSYLRSKLPISDPVEEVKRLNLGSPSKPVGGIMDLSNQKLKGLDQSLFSIDDQPLLREINLSRNEISVLPAFLFEHPSVSVLNASFNILTAVPKEICGFSRLSTLNLSNNQLSSLTKEIGQISTLRTINLGFNHFQEIPPCLFEIIDLDVLILCNNKIIAIDIDKLLSLRALSTLDLANNSIGQLPPKLGLMKGLKLLCVTGNTFRVPRQHLLDKGTEAVLHYLRDKIPQ